MIKLGVDIQIDSDSDLDIQNFFQKSDKLSTSDITTSNNSSNSNLLGIDPEQFLTRSPAATRRISCCSMLNPAEAAALAAAAATTAFYSDTEKKDKEKKEDKENRKLPIINPLVRLPTWPSEYLAVALSNRKSSGIFSITSRLCTHQQGKTDKKITYEKYTQIGILSVLNCVFC